MEGFALHWPRISAVRGFRQNTSQSARQRDAHAHGRIDQFFHNQQESCYLIVVNTFEGGAEEISE